MQVRHTPRKKITIYALIFKKKGIVFLPDGKGKIPFDRKLFIDNNSSEILLTSFSGTDILEILEKGNLQQQYRKQIEK